MKNSSEVYINFKGGIVSPGHLLGILQIASDAGVKDVKFSLRQQLVMSLPGKNFQLFENACIKKNIRFATKKNNTPNIVSSYAAANIFTGESWLREGVYKDIFDQFYYTPKLKINICDSRQHLVPFFTGHINWVSSTAQHFWHLYIRLPGTGKPHCWPDLVYTNDIAAVSQKLEELILQLPGSILTDNYTPVNNLAKPLQDAVKYISKPAEGALVFNAFYFPYYEGLNKDGADNWLGIYRRDELFSISFLMDICNICLETKIGQLYTTPWKSLIIKGIKNADRRLWDYALGKNRINIRHAANELNWQVEDGTEDGLVVKRHIIRHFDKEDVRTYGLIFAVQTLATSNMYGSVIIRLRHNNRSNRLKSLERFDILHTKDFNPNSKELVVYRDNVEKDFIGTYLVSLCKYFYERGPVLNPIESLTALEKPSAPSVEKASYIYQCKKCMTVYDEAFGDMENGVLPGTTFGALPVDYCCALCGAAKKDLLEINKKEFQATAF